MSESNRHILSNAIKELKQHHPPEDVWNGIADELDSEKGRDHLESAITQLPVKSAPDGWAEIQSELTYKEALSNLPLHKHELDDFDWIIDKSKKSKSNVVKIGYWISGVAAMISIALMLNLLMSGEYGNTAITVEYSEEVRENLIMDTGLNDLPANDDVMVFIREHCNLLAAKCESTKFKGLLEQYIELDEAKKELITQIDENRDQEQLVNYLVRVEKEQNEVGKSLIQLLII